MMKQPVMMSEQFDSITTLDTWYFVAFMLLITQGKLDTWYLHQLLYIVLSCDVKA